MTLLSETHRGHAQPVPALHRRLARRLLQAPAHGPRAARPAQPRASSAPPAARPARCRSTCATATTTRPARPPADFQDILGRENYFLELMDHGLDIEKRVRDGLLRLAKDLQIPLLATNDSHYVNREDAPSQEHLLCINSGSTMDIPAGDGPGQRFAFSGDGYYLKSAAEMRDAVGRQVRPARGVRQHPAHRRALRRRRSPRATAPTCRASPARPARTRTPGWSRRSRRACSSATRAASPTRSASRPSSRSASSPRWASRATSSWSPTSSTGPRTTASGSAPAVAPVPGSMVAYAMRITDLDPLEHGLIFERFLNPDRVSMPDFDIDFDERRRGEVIRYVTEKYGDDRVSYIVTYGTIKAKQAVKDSSPDPGLPVRDGRPDHQGDAGRGDGQGRPAQGHLRPPAQALRRGRRVPRRSTSPTTTSSASSTPRSASRASSGSGACTPPASSCPASR